MFILNRTHHIVFHCSLLLLKLPQRVTTVATIVITQHSRAIIMTVAYNVCKFNHSTKIFVIILHCYHAFIRCLRSRDWSIFFTNLPLSFWSGYRTPRWRRILFVGVPYPKPYTEIICCGILMRTTEYQLTCVIPVQPLSAHSFFHPEHKVISAIVWMAGR